MNTPSPLPVHVIAGPLGVGKTTAILSYVQRNAGFEHVAVLVNDFGPVSIDGAILQSSPGSSPESSPGSLGQVAGDTMKVLTIPGGCICCATPDALASGIPKLARLPGVTRLIIEPSGIAMPAQVIDLLRALPAELNLDIRPTIVLLDAAEFRHASAEHMPYYRRLVEAADVLVANRCDKATDRAVTNFRGWAETLDPPKLRVITTTMGELPDEVFGLTATPPAPPHPHRHHHHAPDDQAADGVVWDASTRFDAARLRRAIAEFARMTPPLARFKGLFHTTDGWRLLQIARSQVTDSPTDHRRDNRAAWITPPAPGNSPAPGSSSAPGSSPGSSPPSIRHRLEACIEPTA